MALIISVGSGATVATDQIASIHYGQNKIVDGTIGSTNALIVDAAGNIGSIVTVANTVALKGNITITGPVSLAGNITLTDSKGFIGLTTTVVGNSPSVQGFGQFFPSLQSIASGGLGPLALDNFGRVQVKITADPNTYIGLATVDIGTNNKVAVAGNVTLSDPKTFIGSVSVSGFQNPMPVSGTFFQTTQPISVVGNVTLSDPKTFIGAVSVSGFTSPLPVTGTFFQTTQPVSVVGNVTLSDPKTFIGLVTAQVLLSGTTKTLTTLPVVLSTASIQTVVTPTNANTIYITNLVLSSDATVQVRIKSGVTYLTGNASLGVSLNPGGGFVMAGLPGSPAMIGMPSGALNVEKFDMTATKANIGGAITYFQE